MSLTRSAALFALLILSLASSTQAQQVPSATAQPITEAPTIDGRLDEAEWASAQLLNGFVQREPAEGTAVSQRTEVRILFDGEALYVGAWLYDEDPSAIVQGQSLRDASLDEADAFSLIFDTYRDRQNGFVFGTTAAGIEYDGQVTNEGQGGGGGVQRQQTGSAGGFNLNWDGSWEVETTTDGEGWYAEMRIPFSTLRYDRGGEQSWGVNFERRIRRNNEQSVWAPLPRQFTINRVSLAGQLALTAPARRIATVTPFVLGAVFRDFVVPGSKTESDPEFGADAKLGLTQSLTLDLTVNTDFALAEVDDQQVNLTRFPLFFPEKRAFFLENAGTYTVGSGRSAELFFSRRIGLASGTEVPIQAGARLTGKLAGLQIGFLNIQTDDVVTIDDVTQLPDELAPPNNFGVLRVFQEFDNRTRLGGIFVSRLNTASGDDYNLTYGLDGRLGVGQDLTFDGWFGLTTTPLAEGALGDREGFNNGEYGFNGGANYLTRDWEVSAGYRQIGTEFNPEVGFLSRAEYRHFNARALWHWRTPSVSWFREFRPHISGNQFWALDGFSESYMVHIDSHFQFENGAFFQFPGINLTGEGLKDPFEIDDGVIIPPGQYNNVEWAFRYNTNRSSPLSLSGGWTLGGFYTGTQFGPNAELAYRFQDRFTASVRANYFDVRLDEGDFTRSVFAFNGSYSFTPSVYLQATVQYNDATRDVGANIRMGWLDTAGTGLFIVLNDTEHRGPFDRTGFSTGPKQRRLVIKYTKLLNFTR